MLGVHIDQCSQHLLQYEGYLLLLQRPIIQLHEMQAL